MKNPCDAPLLRKMFRPPKYPQWDFLEKETVDEIIFKIPGLRDRLLVEIMARGGLRISEVLKLKVGNVDDRKLLLRDTKSGKEAELAFIPSKVGGRLKEYIEANGFQAGQRIFSMGYSTAREIVRKAGERVGVALRPHDLRRHAATYASRCGTPIEIVSKIILRHAHLATTQRYLGKVTDTEAMRWIETLYG